MDKEFFKKHGYLMVFFCFFIFLILQYQKVFLYFDDYGYMDMSYGYNVHQHGSNNPVYNVLVYTYHSYFDVSGRIFTNFLLAVTSCIGGLSFMRIFLPVCICVLYYFGMKIIEPSNCSGIRKMLLAFFLVMSYGIFPITVNNSGMYWFAAAYGYMIPTMIFMGLVLIYRRGNIFVTAILSFILCISCEQAVAMTFSWIIVNLVVDYLKEKKIDKKYFLPLSFAVVGSAILVSSPASRSRFTGSAQYGQPFFQTLIFNSAKVVHQIYYLEPLIQYGLLSLGMIVGIFYLIRLDKKEKRKENKSKKKMLHVLWVIYICCMIVMNVLCLKGVYYNRYVEVILWTIYFVVLAVYLCVFFYEIDIRLSGMVVSAYASMVLMFLMPDLPHRAYIPFLFLMVICGAGLIVNVQGGVLKEVIVLTMTVACFFCFSNLKTIYEGYCLNAGIFEENDRILREASENIRNNVPVEQITLYKPLDIRYCGLQPYQEGISFMLFGYDDYYGIPYETTYAFRNYYDENDVQIIRIVE